MSRVTKLATAAAAAAFICQPIAAAAEVRSASIAVTATGSAAEHIDFDLGRHQAESSKAGAAALTVAGRSISGAQQPTVQTEPERRRRGPSTTTWLVIGGVVLAVALLAAVASAAPTPGPPEGAFD